MLSHPEPDPQSLKATRRGGQHQPEIARYFEDRQRRRTILKTTTTPSGQVIDWVPMESQAPHGKIATPPTAPPIRQPKGTRAVTFELHNPSVERGPAGTVPVVRPNLGRVCGTRSLNHYLGKRSGRHTNLQRSAPVANPDPNLSGYYHAQSAQIVNAFGCSSWVNVWNPYVEISGDHSIMQFALQNSQDVLQSLEAGWTVDPDLNGDDAPHLFTYYTTNDYSNNGDNLGGYNQMVDGWVQVDTSVMPGANFSSVSSQGEAPVGFSMQFQLTAGNWWLAIQGVMIGYYPATLFSPFPQPFRTLAAFAEAVGFWAEVETRLSTPELTRTQMGSGRRAETGFSHACFQSNLMFQNHDGTMTDHDGTITTEDAALFDIEAHLLSGGNFGS